MAALALRQEGLAPVVACPDVARVARRREIRGVVVHLVVVEMVNLKRPALFLARLSATAAAMTVSIAQKALVLPRELGTVGERRRAAVPTRTVLPRPSRRSRSNIRESRPAVLMSAERRWPSLFGRAHSLPGLFGVLPTLRGLVAPIVAREARLLPLRDLFRSAFLPARVVALSPLRDASVRVGVKFCSASAGAGRHGSDIRGIAGRGESD